MIFEHTIRPGHDDDVWRDENGHIWVRKDQLVEAVKFNVDRLRAAADQLEAVAEWRESGQCGGRSYAALGRILDGASDD